MNWLSVLPMFVVDVLGINISRHTRLLKGAEVYQFSTRV
jgi:hypothetical protein